MPKGRKKGFKITEEQKLKMKEGRLAKKQATPVPVVLDKPVLIITGYELTGFDFWPLIRKVMRPLHRYDQCKAIEKEIVDPSLWNNLGIVKNLLSRYFDITIMVNAPKPKTKRTKKSGYVMTEEHKEKLRQGRANRNK